MERAGKKQGHLYDGEDVSASIAVPIYDSTLLNFVKSMNTSGIMDRNYPYVYSKYGMHTYIDEIFRIEKCDLKDMDVIIGIISKYVLGGMSKGILWNIAVEEGIFFHALVRIKDILEKWGEEDYSRSEKY
jgi:predicted transcriptional regulator with HTH domain